LRLCRSMIKAGSSLCVQDGRENCPKLQCAERNPPRRHCSLADSWRRAVTDAWRERALLFGMRAKTG
jgi:hypothetical protein